MSIINLDSVNNILDFYSPKNYTIIDFVSQKLADFLLDNYNNLAENDDCFEGEATYLLGIEGKRVRLVCFSDIFYYDGNVHGLAEALIEAFEFCNDYNEFSEIIDAFENVADEIINDIESMKWETIAFVSHDNLDFVVDEYIEEAKKDFALNKKIPKSEIESVNNADVTEYVYKADSATIQEVVSYERSKGAEVSKTVGLTLS